MIRRWAWLVGMVLAVILSAPQRAAGRRADDPVSLVRGWLDATAPAARAAALQRLVGHPAYKPSRLSGWLHRAWRFPDAPSGLATFTVPMAQGDRRTVHVLVPPGYRPDRAWPLVYALHPSGTKGVEWIEQVRAMLGRRAREFVIAAPTDYRQNYIAAKPPFVPEHPLILDTVARAYHLDASRTYVIGYSKGGYGAWFVSLYYSDRIAGAIALAAGFDVTVGEDGFWEELVDNVAHVPVYNAWGSRDPLVARGLDGRDAGTFAEQNRVFAKLVARRGLPITNTEVPGGVHNNLAPPVEPIVEILAARREADPRRITHTFRHLHQASAYWLEGLSWTGERWDAELPPLVAGAAGESERHRIARTLAPLLGRLTGEIDGQRVRVTRRHVGDLVVWFGERTIDWDKAVRVEVDGRVVFDGRLARDAGVALARAASTLDFDALCWAGVRVDAEGRAQVVTADRVPGPAWKAALVDAVPRG